MEHGGQDGGHSRLMAEIVQVQFQLFDVLLLNMQKL